MSHLDKLELPGDLREGRMNDKLAQRAERAAVGLAG
jgi:hypothetical protein